MTIPGRYVNAERDFDRLLTLARDEANFATRNPAYTMVQAVLQCFRRRLSLRDAVRFAGALPAIASALFVADWDLDEPQRPFGDRAAMLEEVKELRREHNISPDSAIEDVAIALRTVMGDAALDAVLETFPPGAKEFWRAKPR